MSSSLHNDVRAVRTRHKLSQAELGAACGVTRQTIAAIEAGNYAPSVVVALSIATALTTTVHKLFWLERKD